MGILRHIFNKSKILTSSIDNVTSNDPESNHRKLEKGFLAPGKAESANSIGANTWDILHELVSNDAIPEEIRTFITLYKEYKEDHTRHSGGDVSPGDLNTFTSAKKENDELNSIDNASDDAKCTDSSEFTDLDNNLENNLQQTICRAPKLRKMASYSLTIPRLQAKINHWLTDNCISNFEESAMSDRFMLSSDMSLSQPPPEIQHKSRRNHYPLRNLENLRKEPAIHDNWTYSNSDPLKHEMYETTSCNSSTITSQAPSLTREPSLSNTSSSSKSSGFASIRSSYGHNTWESSLGMSHSNSETVSFSTPLYRTALQHKKFGQLKTTRHLMQNSPELSLRIPNKYVGNRRMSGPYPCIASNPIKSSEFIESSRKQLCFQMPQQLPYRIR